MKNLSLAGLIGITLATLAPLAHADLADCNLKAGFAAQALAQVDKLTASPVVLSFSSTSEVYVKVNGQNFTVITEDSPTGCTVLSVTYNR